jgi:alkylation response protein AidB-like acyl-CoA dehydrogenase
VEELILHARETTGPDGRALIASERVADDLATLRTEVTALKAMTYRTVSEVARTNTPGAEASIVRLYTSELSQRVARCEVDMMGQTMLDFRYGVKDPTQRYLYGFAQTIAGGSAQIQRNIIGERVLGLPK